MDKRNEELTEEELIEAVAAALGAAGLSAFSQDTGGGVCCVVLPRKNGGEILWGTADITWGASITDADDQVISSITTTCRSDTRDPRQIADVLRQPSIDAGAEFSTL